MSRKGEDIKSKDAAIDVGIMLVKNVREVMKGKYVERSAQKWQMLAKIKDQGKY